MEGDVDAFLEEVRSSEKLLQELQERLRSVVANHEQVQTDVAALKREQHVLAEESLRNEQELTTVSSQTLLQDVRLKKILGYKTDVKGDLGGAEEELSGVRTQLEGDINKLCSEASTHLTKFGLNGVYHAEAKQYKLDELSKTKTQTEQLSYRIKDLQQHENILKEELQKLVDTERDIENKRQSLRQPLQGRAHVHELQQTLCRMVQEQRDGRHLQQLKADISDAEDETTCLRSAASAMSAELQRLEQLLWFNNMEKMKQRMRATAKCPGQYHCSTAGVFNASNSSTSVPESANMGPSKPTRPWPGRMATPTGGEPASDRGPVHTGSDLSAPGTGGSDAAYDDSNPPQDWSASDAEKLTRSSAAPSEGDVPGVNVAAAAAVSAATATRAAAGADPCTAELAQRRWRARRALMMAHRQPAAQPQPPHPPAFTAASTAAMLPPPLASVRPQLRPQPTEPGPAASRRQWGRAAGPGRLSYRGPQPAKRTTDFRTGLQKLRESLSATATATAPQKRVRFSTEPAQEEVLHCDEMEDFL